VNVGGCSNITDAALASLAKYCPRIQSLDLTNTQITDEGLARIGAGCRALKKLICWSCEAITDEGVSKVAAGCSSLENLNITGCPQVKYAALASLAQNCAHLHFLDLTDTTITDEGLVYLEGCKALKHIVLRYLTLSDAAVGKLAKCCTNLDDVNLEGCNNITIAAAESLAQNCAKLKYLSLKGTQATHEELDRLRDAYPALYIEGEEEEDEEEEGEGDDEGDEEGDEDEVEDSDNESIE
jgi:F-box/leucine-rich repeat protein 2/20